MDDHEKVRHALARYCQLNDDGRFDEWGELLVDDARFQFGDLVVNGREEIKALVASFQPPEKRGRHFMGNQVIDIDGDGAEVIADFVFFEPSNPGFNVFAADRYHDRLVRSGDAWLFSEIQIVPFG
jgi:3-phenylpropionate/cinnamic acid dioxygenase small subunit